MKVVSGQVMQSMDYRAIHEFGVPGIELMERAGAACADAIVESFASGEGKRVLVVAGKGNNGGDGYVIARLLAHRRWQAQVLLLATSDGITGDAAANLVRLEPGQVVYAPEGAARHAELFGNCDLIVDALLGTGLKSEVTGSYAEAIDMINAAGKPVLAVDIPSGVDAANGRVLGKAVRADLTVTFALAKLGNIIYPGAKLCGRLVVADIGMPAVVIDQAEGIEFVDLSGAHRIFRPREIDAHKGSNGHCLIVAGSPGKTGAAAMAANSAVRAGAGLVTLAIPAALNQILEVKSTEAMTVPVGKPGTTHFQAGVLAEILTLTRGRNVVALGPGLGTHASTVYLVHSLLGSVTVPLVIDADGLNAVAVRTDLLQLRRDRVTVLTPHPGEMARLCRCTIAEVEADRIQAAREFTAKHEIGRAHV
jgi:ADP-dependent NAD(P)H-hydrate dehydratase / NAD(P)H-hydrate epimerase